MLNHAYFAKAARVLAGALFIAVLVLTAAGAKAMDGPVVYDPTIYYRNPDGSLTPMPPAAAPQVYYYPSTGITQPYYPSGGTYYYPSAPTPAITARSAPARGRDEPDLSTIQGFNRYWNDTMPWGAGGGRMPYSDYD